MRTYLLEFLKTLERLVPPPPKCHHVLLYSRYGGEEKWTDELTLQVNIDGVFHALFLEDMDFKEKPFSLAIRIQNLLTKTSPLVTQISRAAGTFTKTGDEILKG